jgi:CrcB protein
MNRWPVPLIVWVALGSALGASARWGLGHWLLGSTQVGLPSATVTANLLGSTMIGLYAALVSRGGRLHASEAQRAFVMAGFCGGFTTFSLFTAEVLALIVAGDGAMAATLAGLSVVAWLGGVWLGYRAGQYINQRGADIG